MTEYVAKVTISSGAGVTSRQIAKWPSRDEAAWACQLDHTKHRRDNNPLVWHNDLFATYDAKTGAYHRSYAIEKVDQK